MTIKKPILYDYFEHTSEILLSEYKRSKTQKSPVNLGLNRELFCNNFLSRVLPSRLNVKQGEIWDSKGNKTGQIDTIILRDDAPSLTFGTVDSYLAEGVFSVIEVKSNLTKTKLQEALNILKQVKSLNLSGKGMSVSIGPTLNRPLRCIFAYEGASWKSIVEVLRINDNSEIPDLISILRRGILIKKGLLLKWKEDSPYYQYDSKAASLAWLYFHLVSYSISFMGQGLTIEKYFEPTNGWKK